MTLTLRRENATLAGVTVGEGPTAVLLHAGGERRQVWDQVAATLAARGFRSIAYDLRGHGESSTDDAESLQAHADDVAGMISAEEAPVVVVGASLGGLAALLAVQPPDVRADVAGLVLVDVVPNLSPQRVRAYLDGVSPGLADRPIVDDVLSRTEDPCAGARELGQLPTLLVRGGRSAMTDADVSRFTQLAPRARVAVIPDAGHLVARDRPVELAELVRSHLDADATRRRRIDRLLEKADAGRVRHPGGTLLEHLHRAADTLQRWGAPAYVVDAARLHAAYGTDGFPHPMPGVTRRVLIAVAGQQTERLVDLYGHCRRGDSYPTFLSDAPAVIDRRTSQRRPLAPSQLRAFAELTVANELDVLAHSPELAAAHGAKLAELFTSWAPLISPAARQAAER